ncbi:hypothetical protein GCM10010344_53560 [Streptomyces bluensis]|nr:hypothetical protein GCM10010344_53560 [Streptomyces bluensis]
MVRLEPLRLEWGDQVLVGVTGAFGDADLFAVWPVEECDGGIGEVQEGRVGGTAVPDPVGDRPVVLGSGEAFVLAVSLPRQVLGEGGGEGGQVGAGCGHGFLRRCQRVRPEDGPAGGGADAEWLGVLWAVA